MERIRSRVSDKRVLALAKAFLKAGVMHHGLFKDSLTGAPQGGILSPLLANIALTALDEHFHTQWHTLMGTDYQRTKRRRTGQGNWRLIRYCDDFVVMVSGPAERAEIPRKQIAEVLARLGLRLSMDKTRMVHIDDGFDFLGQHIRRQRKRGSPDGSFANTGYPAVTCGDSATRAGDSLKDQWPSSARPASRSSATDTAERPFPLRGPSNRQPQADHRARHVESPLR